MKDNLNWAVLGTGVIANEMAQTLQKMGKKLYAVGNRTHAKAVAFAEKYGIEMVYDCIDDMFLDENVDIIYITSPHNTHFQFMEKALTHGKHILEMCIRDRYMPFLFIVLLRGNSVGFFRFALSRQTCLLYTSRCV